MSVSLLIFLSFIAVVGAHGHSKTVQDFLSFYIGHWNNKAHIEETGPEYDFFEVWNMPVDIPALSPKPVALTKQFINGVLRILNLGVISEGPEKNSFKIKIYNFTDITQVTQVKPDKLDVQTLKDLTLDDLHTDEDSDAVFRFVEDDVVSGTYPYTNVCVRGRHPRFSITITSHNQAVTIPVGTDQKAAVGPYILQFIGPRYKMRDPPEGYESPCHD